MDLITTDMDKNLGDREFKPIGYGSWTEYLDGIIMSRIQNG